MGNRVVVRVSEEAMKAIKARAASEGSEIGMAADAMLLGAPVKAAAGAAGLVSGEHVKEIESLAKKIGVEPDAMASRLLKMGFSRHKALGNYADAQKGVVKPPKTKKTKKAKSKKG
jgi:hypothetical protein